MDTHDLCRPGARSLVPTRRPARLAAHWSLQTVAARPGVLEGSPGRQRGYAGLMTVADPAVILDELNRQSARLTRMEERLDRILEILENPVAQADIDAAVAAMNTGSGNLTAAAPLIQAELAKTGADDTTALPGAVANLVTAVNGITALVPAAPPPLPPPGG
jgi:hypothetical protein